MTFEPNKTIHTPEKTWDNLEIGDVVIELETTREITRKVLDIATKGFVLGKAMNCTYYTFEEAKKYKFKIKQPKKQHTHKELEEKLGYEFDIIN